MNYKETTQIPNNLFDTYIPKLKPSTIIILLIILRQTNGWYDPKTKKRKIRDWISYAQFQSKTGLSRKTISKGINELITQNIIKATNRKGLVLISPSDRQGKIGIFYTCLLGHRNKRYETYVKKNTGNREKLPITKLTPLKLNKQKSKKIIIKKISDYERINEILKRNNYP